MSKSCGCLIIETISQSKGQQKKNKYIEKEDYIIGFTTNGEEFYIDKDDYELVSQYCWCKIKEYFISDTKGDRVFLHRLIMNTPNDKDTDHINRKTYDNRKQNLRIVTKSQNQINRRRPKNNTSGIKGVRFDDKTNKWKVYIGINNKLIHLGYYDDKKVAIKIRKNAEKKYHGEYTCKEGD